MGFYDNYVGSGRKSSSEFRQAWRGLRALFATIWAGGRVAETARKSAGPCGEQPVDAKILQPVLKSRLGAA